MKTTTNIIVTHEFYGLHNWEDCPKGQINSFLRYPHRHKFLVKVKAGVSNNNRQIEFFVLQKDIIASLYTVYLLCKGLIQTLDLGSSSCEMIANDLFKELSMTYNYRTIQSIEVWEDNENGAEVIFHEEDKQEQIQPEPKRSFVDRLLWWRKSNQVTKGGYTSKPTFTIDLAS